MSLWSADFVRSELSGNLEDAVSNENTDEKLKRSLSL